MEHTGYRYEVQFNELVFRLKRDDARSYSLYSSVKEICMSTIRKILNGISGLKEKDLE